MTPPVLHGASPERESAPVTPVLTHHQPSDVDAPAWPWCERCSRTARPGLECARALCPWQRTEGTITE